MTHYGNWRLDAHVERIEFSKTQDGEPFLKVVKLVGGERREHRFPLHDYELARDEIIAALSVGEEPWYDWGAIEYLVETIGPMVSGPTRPGLYEDCFVLPNGQVLFALANHPGLPVFLPSVDGSRSGLPVHEGSYEEWAGIADLAHGNPLLYGHGLRLHGPRGCFAWDRRSAHPTRGFMQPIPVRAKQR